MAKAKQQQAKVFSEFAMGELPAGRKPSKRKAKRKSTRGRKRR